MARLLKLFIPCFLLMSLALVSYAQNIATWEGSPGNTPSKSIQHPDDKVGATGEPAASLKLSLKQDGIWHITYQAFEFEDSNHTQKPLSLLFVSNNDGDSLTVTGSLLPDSSVINCAALYGSAKTSFVLHKLPPPISWNGATTIKGNKTTLRLTYQNDPNWEIIVQNDSINAGTIDQPNNAKPPKVSFDLIANNNTDMNYGRIEGTISPDSSSIACTLFMSASASIHLTLYKEKKSIEQNTGKSDSVSAASLWWWCTGAWVIFSVVMFLYFTLRKKVPSISADASIALPDNDWLKKILPIVRVSCKKIFPGNRKVLIIYNDSLVLFHTNKKTNIDKLHDEGSEAMIHTMRGLKNVQQIPVASIEKIKVEKESRLGKVRFHIFHNGKKENFVLPGYEMPNVIKSLQSVTGNRLQTGYPIQFHGYGIWIQLLVFSFGAIYIYTNLLQPGTWLSGIIYIIIFIAVSCRIAVLLFSSITWFRDQLPRKLTNPKNKKPNADLSHRKPFRSMPIAIFLKIAGASVFILTFLLLKENYLPAFFQDWIVYVGPFFKGFLIAFGYLLVGLILNLSLAFANRNPKAVRPNDARPPILYLRSFLDDRETTFQPGTWLSYFLGVDPPYYQLSKYRFIPDSLFYRVQKIVFKYVYNNHPIRMLRLILGWPVDTSEQQLELYFRKKGPFVAIGKPGERIITSGANRMYVTNEEWQNVILEYLHKSQLVVLQPSSTEGIWWEINQSLNIVEPGRFFLCMVNYQGHQNFYEDFRLRIENAKAEIKLPRFTGNTQKICFFRFNAAWTPELLRLTYKSFIYWPFQGNAADLKKSLGV